jgi:hypothetical protein
MGKASGLISRTGEYAARKAHWPEPAPAVASPTGREQWNRSMFPALMPEWRLRTTSRRLVNSLMKDIDYR